MASSSIRALGFLAFLNNIPPTEQEVESGNTPLVGTPLKLAVVSVFYLLEMVIVPCVCRQTSMGTALSRPAPTIGRL